MKLNELTTINSLAEVTVTAELIKTDEFSSNYMLLASTIKQLEAIKAELDAKIKAEMGDHYMKTGEQTLGTDNFSFTYVPGGVKMSFDAAALKKDDIDTYNKYLKSTATSPALRTNNKKKGDGNV